MKDLNSNEQDYLLKRKKSKKIREEYLIELLDLLYDKNFLKKNWNKFRYILKKILDADNVYIEVLSISDNLKKKNNFPIVDNIKLIKKDGKLNLIFIIDTVKEKYKIVVINPRTLVKSDFILLRKIQEIINTSAKEEKKQQEIIKYIYIDPLTKLYNRYFLETVIPVEIEKVKRYKQPLGIIFIDIDNFKYINDTYGHIVGDVVLKTLADLIKTNIRKADIPVRLGGDEILILLPFTPKRDVVLIAQKLKNLIENRTFDIDQNKISLTISAGVSEISRKDNFEDILNKVDKALLQAKKEGKNKIVIV